MSSNPFIELTPSGWLRLHAAAAHANVRPQVRVPFLPVATAFIVLGLTLKCRARGYQSVGARMSRRQGYDVEGVNPNSGRRLVIECKGEAQAGSQHARSWGNVASAILTSLNEINTPANTNEVGIALPNTPEYRGRMSLLQQFFKREGIAVFWVSEIGEVVEW